MFAFTCLSIFSLAEVCSGNVQATTELLKNGGFEKVEGERPTNWRFSYAKACVISVDSEKHEGKRSLSFKTENLDGGRCWIYEEYDDIVKREDINSLLVSFPGKSIFSSVAYELRVSPSDLRNLIKVAAKGNEIEIFKEICDIVDAIDTHRS